MGTTNAIQNMLIEEAKKKRVPLMANLELLPVCNLECRMCYVRLSMQQAQEMGGLRSKEEWLALAREMRDAGVLFLLLTGGEVFVYPEFAELYTELYNMGFAITLNTNATMIDEARADLLKKYPPKCVSISLYGASDETYERLCGRKGMFTRVDTAVKLLLERGICLELKTILTPENIGDAQACFDYARRMGVKHLVSSYAFPQVRNQTVRVPDRLAPEDAVRLSMENDIRRFSEQEFINVIFGQLKKYAQTREVPGKDLYGFTCGASNYACWITWQGKLTPCAMLENPSAMPFEVGFMQAWDRVKAECDKILMSPKCSRCEKRFICSVCPAANYAETGRMDGTSQYHCRMMETSLDIMQRIAYSHVQKVRRAQEENGEDA